MWTFHEIVLFINEKLTCFSDICRYVLYFWKTGSAYSRELISERLFFSLLTWIPFWMQNCVRNPLSNLNWTFDAKNTNGLCSNFRHQNWKMANKKNTSITVLLFWNCSCFEVCFFGQVWSSKSKMTEIFSLFVCFMHVIGICAGSNYVNPIFHSWTKINTPNRQPK